MHRVRGAECRPAVAAGATEGNSKATGAEGAVDHPLVAGAIERDDGGNVATAKPEEVLRATQVTGAFFASRGDELDRPRRAQSSTRDLLGQRKRDREAAPVVVDPGPDDSRAVATH